VQPATKALAVGPGRARRLELHLVVLAAGAGAIVLHQLLRERWHEVAYDGVGVIILLSMLWGIWRNRPRPARPWLLLAAGVGLLMMGDGIYNALARINGEEVLPSIADAVYIASNAVLSWGVVDVLRLRRHRRDRTAVLDALLVTVAGAGITWVYLIVPSDYAGAPVLAAVVSAAYPVWDLVLLAFLARFLVSNGAHPPAERILATGISLLLVADVAYARLALIGAYGVTWWPDTVYLASYLCFAVAACHPTMRTMTNSEVGYSSRKRARLWLLAGISLALPILAGVEVAQGEGQNALVLATTSAIAFFLLTFRTGVLNTELASALDREEDALRRERILRHLGTVLVTSHDRPAIFDAAVDHARQLAGEGSDALLLFGERSPLMCAVECDRCPRNAVVVLHRGLPPTVHERLLAGESWAVEQADEPELRRLLPSVLMGRRLFVAPVFSGGQLRGALLVAPGAGNVPGRLEDACDAVASAMSLALEAVELAERLVDERSEQRFAAMIRNSSDIVLVLRPDSTVRFVSPSVKRVLGWSVEDLLDRDITGLVHPSDRRIVTDALETTLTTPGTYRTFQCRYRHQDMSWRHLEAIGMSLIDDPAVAGLIVNVRDVTERVRLAESLRASEERLESQVAELQELHRAKNDFVATVSHELRTPLTSILGQLELLADGDYGALVGSQAKAVDVIDRNSHRLLVLIEDLLTVARIDSARLQLQCVPTAIGPFARGVYSSVAAIAEARPVTLALDVHRGLGRASVDVRQMERALTNLLTNAIKFTPPGGRVEFCARRTGDDIVFTVADNGIGIPLDEQQGLFTRFFRSSVANKMAVQGSGLGLVIAKSIVEEHGGAIDLTSAEGLGTTLTVTIPARPAPASVQDVAEGVVVLRP
jgi:PAS domain S-box-containing protein